MSVFDKWNKSIDDDFRKDVEGYDRGEGGDFEKVPYGHYEVKVEKIEMGLSKKKQEPQMCIVWVILDGDQKKRKIWQYQNMTKQFGIHMANEVLRALGSGIEVKFHDYDQYSDLCMDIAEEVSKQKLEYGLRYYEEDGYDRFEVTDVFETE